MLINAGICIAGLLLIHNPYAVVIGILIGLVDALPVFWHRDGTDSVGGYFTAVSQLLCRCGTAVRVCDDVFCPRNHGVKMYGRPAGHCTFYNADGHIYGHYGVWNFGIYFRTVVILYDESTHKIFCKCS